MLNLPQNLSYESSQQYFKLQLFSFIKKPRTKIKMHYSFG